MRCNFQVRKMATVSRSEIKNVNRETASCNKSHLNLKVSHSDPYAGMQIVGLKKSVHYPRFPLFCSGKEVPILPDRYPLQFNLKRGFSSSFHARSELILHGDEYLAQQIANLEKKNPKCSAKKSSIAKNTKLVTFLKWPKNKQNLGGIWAFRVDVLHSPEMMKLIEKDMQKRQCGLGLFQVLHEVDCLESTFLVEDGKTIPSYLLHFSILKPIKALREGPISSDESLERNYKNNEVKDILGKNVASTPFKPKM